MDLLINMKRFLSVILSLLIIALGFACQSPAVSLSSSIGGDSSSSQGGEDQIFKKNMLYGMCYISSERDGGVTSWIKDVKLMNNLGVGCVRNWMHATTLLESKTQINQKACEDMHSLLKAQLDCGMTVIGMSHTNFNKGTALSGKPARDISDGSYYREWLMDYYYTWRTLVKEFPEVEYWEIDNEINNSDFMKNINGEVVYSIKEMADISADMLYYASKAIHSVNSKAKTVLGGITEPTGLGAGQNVEFLEELYKNIKSGEFGYIYGVEKKEQTSTNPDDYFEIACWHPYVWSTFSPDYFVERNNQIYNVILKYEPEGKEVFFTEIGFANANKTEEQTAKEVTELYMTVKERLPYVKTVTYFKLFDVAKKTWTGNLSRYGLFYDPHNRPYSSAFDETVIHVNGAPKPAAYAYQALTGSKEDITILVKK